MEPLGYELLGVLTLVDNASTRIHVDAASIPILVLIVRRGRSSIHAGVGKDGLPQWHCRNQTTDKTHVGEETIPFGVLK